MSITKQAKSYVAYTPALDISTTGKTEKEVKKRFESLVEIFLDEIFSAGTANEVLRELGWSRVERKWTPPKVVRSRSVGVSVPVGV